MDICEHAGSRLSSESLESSTDMESLPDEVLLMVMKHLDVEDLFRCRLVCKRIARLALDPDVWRHRRLYDDARWTCAVLRLAPCLDSLYIRMVPSTSKCHSQQLSRTKCAVANLCFTVLRHDGVGQTERVVRNQEALGRLMGLNVLCVMTGKDGVPSCQAASKLLDLLTSIRGLEELSISLGMYSIPATARPALRSISGPSLKYFSISFRPSDHEHRPVEDFFMFLLAKHASTLEQLELRSAVISPPASLLATMPNLREVRCWPFPGMTVLAASTSLRKLTLSVTPDMVGPETREFLRRAEQLRNVTLRFVCCHERFWLKTWRPSTAGVDLVVDLASSGRSSVEKLCILNDAHCLPQVQPLLRALPLLTSLRHLHVGVAPDELLLGINPTTAPALQSLVVIQTNWMCTHAWLHRPEVKTLLTENPSLHVHVTVELSKCKERPCESCSYGCHHGLCVDQAVFFTHDPEGNCALPGIHESNSYHISDISNLKTDILIPDMTWRDLSIAKHPSER